jgi:hypothetical protein
MTTKKKKAVRKASGGSRKATTKAPSNHVQLRRINLALDLTPAGAREALASLNGALEGSEGSGSAQLRLDARDLNAIYLYLPVRELKNLVGRLRALVELTR